MRTEKLELTIKCKGGHDELRLFGLPTTSGEDDVTIKYVVHIDYLGKVEEKLRAILTLKEKGAVIDASAQELTNGLCLARNVFALLGQIQDQVTPVWTKFNGSPDLLKERLVKIDLCAKDALLIAISGHTIRVCFHQPSNYVDYNTETMTLEFHGDKATEYCDKWKKQRSKEYKELQNRFRQA